MKRILAKIGRILWNLIKLSIILGLIAVLAVGIYLYSEYAKPIMRLQSIAKNIAKESKTSDFSSSLTSIVYDVNGEKIVTLRSAKDAYYLTYEELPKYAIDVMLVTEDKKFYSHGGVDFLANIRAAYELIKHKGKITQGGSTITQQLARTIYLNNEVTYERKIIEIFLSWELEKLYRKTEILEFYMNNIYFSNSYYGLQAAAYGYFGKSAKELSLSQLVFLCAIPNNPSLYDPYLHFDKTLARRDRMLRQMLEDGKITQAQHDAAVAEEILLIKQDVTRHNYVETYVYYCAIRALMEKDGFVFRTQFDTEEEKAAYEEQYEASYSYWQKQLYTGGYRVYTSIDLKLQAQLQQSVDEGTAEFTELTEDGIYTLQAAAVCIDNATGCVAAIVGGRGQEFAGYTLNRAYQSFRQPGSAIKPLIVYTPWFERGLSPDDVLVDEKFEGGPVNSDRSYAGEITVRRALEVSKNTIAWKLFLELTPKVGLSYLNRMGFRRLVESDYVPAAALGGLTYGVSALEMASAYATLENDGIYRTPTCILRITDSEGKEILGNSTYVPQKEFRVYETNAARIMTDLLKGVLVSGTAKGNQLDTAVAAGKTGTTSDKKDGWFVGYTAYYTTSVWIGCDMPKRIDTLSGNTYPLSIWKSFMNKIHKGLPAAEFEPYEPVEATRLPAAEQDKDKIGEESGEHGTGQEDGEETDPTEAEDGNRYKVTPPPEPPRNEEDEFDRTEDPR